MKYTKTILSMLLILSLAVFACSDDDDDNGTPGDFPFEAVMSESTSFLIISVEEWDDRFEANVSMLVMEDHQQASLSVNGNEVELFGYMGYYFGELELMPGQSFSYQIRVDGSTRSGELAIPDVIRADFPDEFNLSSNFSFSWTTSSDPSAFIAFLEVDLDDDWVEHMEMLAGSARSHSFNRNLYSGLSEDDIWYVDVGVWGMNYDIKDDMVIIAGFDAYEKYYFDDDFFFRLTEENEIDRQRDRPMARFPFAIRRLKSVD